MTVHPEEPGLRHDRKGPSFPGWTLSSHPPPTTLVIINVMDHVEMAVGPIGGWVVACPA